MPPQLTLWTGIGVAIGLSLSTESMAFDLGETIAVNEIREANVEIKAVGGSTSTLEFGAPIQLEGAASMRVRIQIGEAPRNWLHLFIFDEDGVLQETVSASKIADDTKAIWSDTITSERVTIGLEVPAGTTASIAVDGIFAEGSGFQPNSVVGSASFEPGAVLAGDLMEQRLDLLAAIFVDVNDEDLGNRSPAAGGACSGMMIAPDLLLTAAHCLQFEPKLCRGTIAIFDFSHSDSDEPYIRRCIEAIYLGHTIDVALLRLDGLPSIGPFPVLHPTIVAENTPVQILQHPFGSRSRIVRDGECIIGQVGNQIYPNTLYAHYETTLVVGFRHFCDTVHGSSGAAILSIDGKTIYGVQLAGHDVLQFNQAVRSDYIVFCIGYQSPTSIAGGNDDERCR